MTSPDSPSAPRSGSGRGAFVFALVVLAGLAFAGWRGWQAWSARDAAMRRTLAEQSDALGARLDALRGEQRAQSLRLQQDEATNRVLREELIGLGQRSALIEQTVEKLADPDRHGAQALLLDETALLLAAGQQRLQLAGDLDGARRAYALAANLLERVDDSRLLDLRQALVQERAALDALGADPRATAQRRLATFAASLPGEGDAANEGDSHASWWRRLLSRVVRVQPSDSALATDPADRRNARAGLELELTLARTAAERRDVAAWREALDRANAWLHRLWPDSPRRRALEARLQALRGMPLVVSTPVFGSTLQQLQALRSH
ncbi:MAG TPA: uroporphyrinogen-III C-methyltransferase [Lysobacter sp.]|nr:uroporphyrinogen-III C-methyltransferase [Lysobacter sp.]